MCDDICICLSIGCSTRLSQGGGDGQARGCPRCNNASVFQTHSRTWIEICCVPLVPCKSKEIWACSICQWQADLNSFQPPLVNQVNWGGGGGGGGYAGSPQMMHSGAYIQPGYGGPPQQLQQQGYFPSGGAYHQ